MGRGAPPQHPAEQEQYGAEDSGEREQSPALVVLRTKLEAHLPGARRDFR